MALHITPTLPSNKIKTWVIEEFSTLSNSIDHLFTSYNLQDSNKQIIKSLDGTMKITVNSWMWWWSNTLTKNWSGDIVYEFNTGWIIQKFTLNKGENDTFKIKVQYADEPENEVVDKDFIVWIITTLAEFLISHFSEYLQKEYSEGLAGIVWRHTAEIARNM